MVYYIIACQKDELNEDQHAKLISDKCMREGNRELGKVFPLMKANVDKSVFKVGSLDQLMELLDTFSKYDAQLDGTCKKNEKMFFEMCKELQIADPKLMIEVGRNGQKVSVEEYIKTFKWDQVRFQTDKSLKVIGAQISGKQRTCEDRLKKLMDEQTGVKNKLARLSKKEGANFLTKDLAAVIYENNVNGKLFVNSHGSELMTSLLVVVPKKMVDKFKEMYVDILVNHKAADYDNWGKRTLANITAKNQNIEDDGQRTAIIEEEFQAAKKEHDATLEMPGVVPFSEKYLGQDDNEGNQLWRVTVMKDVVSEYARILKKQGFPSQVFDFDKEQYLENKKLESKLKMDMKELNDKIKKTTDFNFQELFQALIHLKIMRTFVDGVLRFGIPPKFFMCIIRPDRNRDAKINQKLFDTFAEEHLREMYGQKEEAQDEDFFPYISNALTSPMFLN